MQKKIVLFFLVLSACGSNNTDQLDEFGNQSTTQTAPVCAAGPISLFAETAGNLGSPFLLSEDGEMVAVFAGSHQFDHALFFTKLDQHGQIEILDRLRIPGTAPFSSPTLTKSGTSFRSGFGLAWEDRRDGDTTLDTEIYFARMDENGLVLGSEIRVSQNSGASIQPTLAFSGDSYALIWADTIDDISRSCQEKKECLHTLYFAKLSLTGTLLDPPKRISAISQDATNPRIVWTGGNYLLSYNDTSPDRSASCASQKSTCVYGVTIASLDRDGNIQKSTSLEEMMDPILVKEIDNPDTFLIAWADGLFFGKVSPSGEITEITRKLVPIRGIPHFSLSIGRDELWIALSDTSNSEDPQKLFANDIFVYRVSEEGEIFEANGFPVSNTQSRSEYPFIASVGEGALLVWREVRDTSFSLCEENPQGCIADLALAKISCGEGVLPTPKEPVFAPIISNSLGTNWGDFLRNIPASSPKTLPAPIPKAPKPPPSIYPDSAPIEEFKF